MKTIKYSVSYKRPQSPTLKIWVVGIEDKNDPMGEALEASKLVRKEIQRIPEMVGWLEYGITRHNGD
jgi:hypothetical protein